MTDQEVTYTERGFVKYPTIIDTKGSEVYVQQSSSAEEDAIWIFCANSDPNYKEPSPHLNKQHVRELIKSLEMALERMEEPTDDEDEDH